MPENQNSPFSLDDSRALTNLESSLKEHEEGPIEAYENLEHALQEDNVHADGVAVLTPKAIEILNLPFSRVQEVRAVI